MINVTLEHHVFHFDFRVGRIVVVEEKFSSITLKLSYIVVKLNLFQIVNMAIR
jgi:hypothetical protein